MTLRLNRYQRLINWPDLTIVVPSGEQGVTTTLEGGKNIDMEMYSIFSDAAANTSDLENVKLKHSAFAERISKIKAVNEQADIGAIKPTVIFSESSALDASILALLDASHIEFNVDVGERALAKKISIGPEHTDDPYFEWGGFAAQEAYQYLSQTISEEILNEANRVFIIDAIAEAVSNAIHGDGVNGEFSCNLGQGRHWTLVVIARETLNGAEVSFSVVTGGATMPAIMLRRFHSNIWEPNVPSVPSLASCGAGASARVQFIEQEMMNLAVNPNEQVRSTGGFKVNNLGNGLKNIRSPLEEIGALPDFNVQGFVISDRCVCELFPNENEDQLTMKRLSKAEYLPGALISVRIVVTNLK